MNAAELQIIRKMNQKTEVTVETPYGLTKPFYLKAAVKQGTIFGPLFCSVATDKVNIINGKSYTMIGAEREIENLIFVDDIIGMGSQEKLKSVEKSLQAMEEEKKFNFHDKKSNIMVIKFKRKESKKATEKTNELNINVKKGKIEQVKEIKYLGESFNENGDNKTKIQKRLSKIPYMIQTIKRYGSTEKVGKLSMQVRLKLLETVVMPTILYGTEIFTNITKEEYQEIQKLQKKLLVGTFEVEESTPYWGMISESGIWPIHQMIHYKKLMAYHWFITSNNSRLAKQVLLNQVTSGLPNCWYTELETIAKEYDIDIKIETTSKKTKSKWKKEIKERIHKRIEEIVRDETANKTKLRLIKNDKYERKEYLNTCSIKDVTKIMRFRLNMIKIRANYKGKYDDLTCDGCKEEQETTEHIVSCSEYQRMFKGMKETQVMYNTPTTELLSIAHYAGEIEQHKQRFGLW